MKRILALVLSATLMLVLTACASSEIPSAGGEKTDDSTAVAKLGEAMMGGWTHSESPAVTDEQRAVLEKALDGFAGSVISPVAYLGSQVVAGVNHCFLCQATVTYPGAQPHYVLVYVNVSLDGNATLMNIADLDIGSFCEYGGAEEEHSEGGNAVQIANPFVDYETLSDAAQAAGFELAAPETVEGYDGEKVIQVMDRSMIQVIYHDSDDNRLFIRKEAGSEDISGDYNVYAEENVVTVNGCAVTCKGSDGAVSTAIWTNDGYSYAVMSDIPMSAEAMTALVAQVF